MSGAFLYSSVASELVTIQTALGITAAYKRLQLMWGIADFYVDSAAGNDANDGKTQATAFATIAAGVAAIGTKPNRVLGLKYGSLFREQIASAAPGLTVIAYGDRSAGRPRIYGSTAVAGAWTVVSGNIYSTPLAYTPGSLAWITPAGVVTKLFPGTAGALTANQFAVSGGNLQVNIGKDPTTETIEVPRNISNALATSRGISVGAADQTFYDLKVMFWPDAGTSTTFARTSYYRVSCDYNVFDGFDQSYGGTGFLIDNCSANYNGKTYNGGGGPGDGSSAHDLASGVIQFSTFIGNTKTGVGNEPDTTVTTMFCYFEDNYVDMQVYDQVGGGSGDHTTATHIFAYNIARHLIRNGTWFVNTGNAVPAANVKVHNNTAYYDPSFTGNVTMYSVGRVQDWANNIVIADGYNNCAAMYGGSINSQNNTFYLMTNAWQSGYGPTTESGLLTTNPQVNNPVTGDYGLGVSSPAKTSGLALGYEADYYGSAVPAASPSRGAVQYV